MIVVSDITRPAPSHKFLPAPLDFDAADCLPVGTTARGTRLEVSRCYREASLRICSGNIEYHYFAGFSGGSKAVVPGLCTYAAISDNHRMMLESAARAGMLDGNPLREDIDEAAGMIGIDYLFNVGPRSSCLVVPHGNRISVRSAV